MKLLLNAEAFGYGPAAAISAIFEVLMQIDSNFEIDYIGDSHTLDLQYKLPYRNVFIWSDELFERISGEYDYFITALDFKKARFAKQLGVQTIVYDTLCWYWERPNKIKDSDYYIAQDFFGVRSRISAYPEIKSFIIPPLVAEVEASTCLHQKKALINFGGLDNPYWSSDITAMYVEKVSAALYPVLKEFFSEVSIVCGKKHLTALKSYSARNVSYSEMQELMQTTKMVICTPGLGNIYELANYSNNFLFLPPANDSQGQQLEILVKNNLASNCLDWKYLTNNIDYFESQPKVLDFIKSSILNLNVDDLKLTFFSAICNLEKNRLNKLFNLFGSSGRDELNLCLRKIIYEN